MLDHMLLTNSISSTCGATSKIVGAESLDRVEMACLENMCVQRRLLFAASFLPPDMPHYWNVVTSFANQDASGTKQGVTAEAKLVLENIKILYNDAFSVDVLPMSHVGQ